MINIKEKLDRIVSKIFIWALKNRIREYTTKTFVSNIELNRMENIDGYKNAIIIDMIRNIGNRMHEDGIFLLEQTENEIRKGVDFKIKIKAIR